MTTIALKDAGYTAKTSLFSNLTLSIGPGDRVGVVAANGAGKTTLLKCITGENELSTGSLTLSRGARVGYVPQDVPKTLTGASMFDAVASGLNAEMLASESWRVDVVLDSLSTPDDIRLLPVRQLSGGWQRLMLLARAWVADPDVLVLDEPTNHLDLEKILLLENWFAGIGEVPVLISSHDRGFLDAVTNRTLFLRPDQSRYFALPYSRARDALALEDESDAVKRERELKEASQLRQQSAKLKNIGINSGSDLLQKKQKQLRERAEKIEAQVKSLHKERSGDIRLANRGTHAKVLVAFEDLTVATPDGRKLFSIPKLHLFQGDRIVLLGRNGTGKTTLIEMLRRVLLAGEAVGGIKATPSLVTGYMDQALDFVPSDESPFAYISALGPDDQRTRALLAGAGVGIDMHAIPIGRLSPGQRARLGLLALRLIEPNFYLLDEPTNHVDIAGQEALADEIKAHEASCVLVSHDRAFVRDVANRFLLIDKGRLIEVDDAEGFFRVMAG
ncbi:ABC-F family ATP-binding cassette domain-containing protein [Pelagibacterium luteolum]|uniref:ATPase components of ABC transporters with duplicated ATPase domains n=1 Tax=Pelagibacterium luteolum TaxID=440168 RepID=A0A1G7W2L4_9HYPH|nr:ABC-F family ATP-binding cassette domain-containing protein [Pelagibacterium luteolum]SDG66121.1 ATPase components of ABC transporters with duplicated ATPase domains [Pelagibacterium luteolum]